MTSPEITIDTLPKQTPAPEAEPTPPQPPTTADEDERSRRRRLILLFILGGLLVLFLGFALWYLLFRKPITQIIPSVTTFTPPAYVFSVYGANHPNGVAVSPDGSRIYVTQSQGDQSLLVFDNKGAKVGTLTPPSEISERATQVYVAVDPKSGEVYATDRVAGSVYVYNADGSFEKVFEPATTILGFQPLGIGFGQNGHLYIADVGGAFQKIHDFDANGNLVRDIGETGTFNFPNGIAGDSTGNVYVTDSNNGRLLVFDKDGKQVSIVPRGNATGELGLPRGMAIDGDGRVYVVDTTAGRVEVFKVFQSGDGRALKHLGSFGTTGLGDAQFAYPNGGAADARGRVYVTDWGNDRIQVWSY